MNLYTECFLFNSSVLVSTVRLWVRRARGEGGSGKRHVWSGVRRPRPQQPGPTGHQRNTRERQQVRRKDSLCFLDAGTHRYIMTHFLISSFYIYVEVRPYSDDDVSCSTEPWLIILWCVGWPFISLITCDIISLKQHVRPCCLMLLLQEGVGKLLVLTIYLWYCVNSKNKCCACLSLHSFNVIQKTVK